jgi:hypothetical protein
MLLNGQLRGNLASRINLLLGEIERQPLDRRQQVREQSMYT